MLEQDRNSSLQYNSRAEQIFILTNFVDFAELQKTNAARSEVNARRLLVLLGSHLLLWLYAVALLSLTWLVLDETNIVLRYKGAGAKR